MKGMGTSGFRAGAGILRITTILAGALAFGLLVHAQEGAGPGPEPGGNPNPGARAVRLSYVDGQVQLSQGSTVLASRAAVNTPLLEGAQLSTGEDGRAEVQFEDGSVARISPNSSLTLAVLRQAGNGADTQIVLNGGLGYFEIQGDTDADHNQIRFGDATVTTSGFSVIRVDMDDPPGEVSVFSGSAHIEGASNFAADLHGGESVKLNAADPAASALSEGIEPDSWDAWNSDRDQVLTSEQAERTQATASEPNSNNPAWSDLDANGNWYNVPGQGYVWSPYDASNSGWDPYGCGSWVYEPGYGYVWASCESWGYMPYESGYWDYYDGFGWGWCPGGSPWWGVGYWGFNVRRVPVHYHPPNRPRGGPVHPIAPIHPGGRFEPYPVLAVNRIHSGTYGEPVRVKGGPITIAGNNVQPLRPISPRPVYPGGLSYRGGGTAASASGRSASGFVRYGSGQTPNYGVRNTMPAVGAYGNYGTYARPSGGPARAPAYSYGGFGARPSAPSASRGYSGGSAPHPSGGFGGGSAPRAGGGGGGGAPHASGGGGGGGGGASHGGGGGGGGSAHH
ncbi:MAG TPA: FecR family protein [Terracidiphilus sp.]|nr:FecR family protein [Terracidiphilus sp.]